MTHQGRHRRPSPVPREQREQPPTKQGGGMSGKVLGGARWSLLNNLGSQGIQFISSVILARLLTPATFGLIATIWVFSGFAVIIFQFGLGQSLIHLKKPTERHRATVFWVNALSGAAYFIVMSALGPVLQNFFHAPGLEGVLPIVASSLLFDLSAVQFSLMQKTFRFREIAQVSLASTLAGQLTSVVLAIWFRNAYVIAIAYPITTIVMTVMYYQRLRWLPKHFIDRQSLRDLWGFSAGLLGAQIVAYWSQNIDNLVIGRGLGEVPLALYNRAYNLMTMPVTQVGRALSTVVFPALSAIRSEPWRLRSAHMRSCTTIAFLLFPAISLIGITAPALVLTLWGPRWAAVTPLLQLLAFAGIPRVMCITSNWLLQARGLTKQVMGTQFTIMCFTFVGAIGGLHWGVRGVALGVLLGNAVATPFAIGRGIRGTPIRTMDILRVFFAPLACCAAMCVVAYYVPRGLDLDITSPGTLGLQVVVGAATYVACFAAVDRATLREVSALFRRRRGAGGNDPGPRPAGPGAKVAAEPGRHPRPGQPEAPALETPGVPQ